MQMMTAVHAAGPERGRGGVFLKTLVTAFSLIELRSWILAQRHKRKCRQFHLPCHQRLVLHAEPLGLSKVGDGQPSRKWLQLRPVLSVLCSRQWSEGRDGGLSTRFSFLQSRKQPEERVKELRRGCSMALVGWGGERLPRLSRQPYEKVQVSSASTGADLIRRRGDARPSRSS